MARRRRVIDGGRGQDHREAAMAGIDRILKSPSYLKASEDLEFLRR